MKICIALIFVLPALALSACGGGDGDSGGNGGGGGNGEAEVAAEASDRAAFEREHPGSAEFGSPPLEFEADPGGDLAYTADEVTAKEGNVTIEFTNPQSVPHNVTVETGNGAKVETETVTDDFAAVTITLSQDEKFIYYCSVPGHRKAGMEGTINVVPRN
jgi:plastocyanin